MENRPTPRVTPQLILGVVAILLGVLFTLDNLDILEADEVLPFWPAVLIVVGVIKMVAPRDTPGRIAGFLFLIAGSVILLANLHALEFFDIRIVIRPRAYWPLLLVFIGAWIAWQAYARQRGVPADSSSTVNAIAIMSGVVRSCNSKDFRGGELTAIMGGCEIDLREAAMQLDEAVIHTFAMWGGIEIKVPEDWTVVSNGFPLMGGFEDSTRPPKSGPQKKLLIKGFAIMGGIEIKN